MSTVDEKGRIVVPKELREKFGLRRGVIIEFVDMGEAILLKPAGGKRRWRELCGIRPKRLGEPEWPTPREVKSIWE